MAALLIIEPDLKLAGRMGSALAESARVEFTVIPGAEASAIAEQGEDLKVVVLGPGVPVSDAFDFVRQLGEARPGVATLLVVREVSADLLRQALRAGLADVVGLPGGDLTELVAAFDVAYERVARAAGGAAGPAVAKHRGRMFTVLSTKGGVGKSVIASNIAVSLASLGVRTVLVDLDLKAGDLGIMLRLQPVRHIADAAVESEHLDEEMLRGFITHHPSGLHVLLAPPRPDDAALVTAPRLSHILDLLLDMYEAVVIDTPPVIDDCVLTAVDKSTRVLLMTTADVTAVKDARLNLQRLHSLGYRDGGVRLVLNRSDSRVFLDTADVEHAVGMDISARVPSDRIVPRSVNKGVPVVEDEPRSAVARALKDLASSLVSEGKSS